MTKTNEDNMGLAYLSAIGALHVAAIATTALPTEFGVTISVAAAIFTFLTIGFLQPLK